MKQQIDRAIKENCLQPEEGARMLQEYEHGLDDYSYLSF
jgi:arginine decarboxylase-like protein